MLFERQIPDEKFLMLEMWPLLQRHYREVAAFKDIDLKPDFDKYLMLEKAGSLRCFVARDVTSDNTLALLGYAVFFVNKNLHYSDSLQAIQDVLFIEKNKRGFGNGKDFINWCDLELSREGVQVVYQHVKTYLNFGPILEDLGYQHIENIWARRLS